MIKNLQIAPTGEHKKNLMFETARLGVLKMKTTRVGICGPRDVHASFGSARFRTGTYLFIKFVHRNQRLTRTLSVVGLLESMMPPTSKSNFGDAGTATGTEGSRLGGFVAP